MSLFNLAKDLLYEVGVFTYYTLKAANYWIEFIGKMHECLFIEIVGFMYDNVVDRIFASNLFKEVGVFTYHAINYITNFITHHFYFVYQGLNLIFSFIG